MPNFKIGMAILAYERPDYLQVCLDSLFQSNLYNYDITFLIQDDGSSDPRVRSIIEKERDSQYKIIRSFTPKGHNSWGAAFNKAVKKLLELDNFDIIGTCDSDALFHPDWLDHTLKVCLWAKENHQQNILGPFSSFNSSDYAFHRVLGEYESPFGGYVVKERMGALNYFFFKDDFLKLGYFKEDKNDETLMTMEFKKKKVRNFCTTMSTVEHVGQLSVLNQWRPTPVQKAVYGSNLAKNGWPEIIHDISTFGYLKDVKPAASLGKNVASGRQLDVVIPVIEKDTDVLPYVIKGVRDNLKHPLNEIIIVAPDSEKIKLISKNMRCRFVDESTVLPITKKEIHYQTQDYDRSGWLFQQLLKLSGRLISSQEFYLVLDADTVLIQPQVFEIDGRQLLLHSDEYHKPYFDLYTRLFGVAAPVFFSFVSHVMLFDQDKLHQIKTYLETKFGKPWYKAIIDNTDKNEVSGFSEYELYGQWMVQNYPNRITREYWFNVTLPRTELADFDSKKTELAKKYRMISFHDYIV